MSKIDTLRQQIVESQTKGKATSALEKQLKEARLDEQIAKEVKDLQQVADQRLKWQREADKIKEKVSLQEEAIARFLALRDSLIGLPVKELLDRAQELIAAQNECYVQFHDTFQFGATVGRIPKGYLPGGFSCPRLGLVGDQDYSYDKAAEGIYSLRAGYGFLVAIVRGSMAAFQREMDDGVGHSGDDDPYPDPGCSVCQHLEREAIDKALKEGVPLRTIEAGHGVSRSSLDRHKHRCLNLGPIRITEGVEDGCPS